MRPQGSLTVPCAGLIEKQQLLYVLCRCAMPIIEIYTTSTFSLRHLSFISTITKITHVSIMASLKLSCSPRLEIPVRRAQITEARECYIEILEYSHPRANYLKTLYILPYIILDLDERRSSAAPTLISVTMRRRGRLPTPRTFPHYAPATWILYPGDFGFSL